MCIIICDILFFIFKCDVEGLGIGFAEILQIFFKKKLNLFEFCPKFPKFPKYRIYRQVPNFFFTGRKNPA